MRGDDRRASGGWSLGPSTPALCFSVRLFFVEFRPSTVLLDCLAYEDQVQRPGHGAWRSGVPLTLELARPNSNWLELARATLERWAEQSTSVQVELTRRPAGPRVRLTDGATSLTLEPAGQDG